MDLLPQRRPVALDDGECEPGGTLVLKLCGQGNHIQSMPQNRAFIQKGHFGDGSSAHTCTFYHCILASMFRLLLPFSLVSQLKIILKLPPN